MYKKACILVAQGVQDEEFIYPYYRLKEDFEVDVIFITTEKYNKAIGKYGIPFNVTMNMNELSGDDIDFALCNEYDILIIPGGWQAPEIMRMNLLTTYFVRQFINKGKIVGAICHGPQVLISAGVCKGRVLTGFAGIHDDLRNAGGYVSNDPVVVNKNLITAQHYKDNPEFMKAVLNTYFNTYVPANYQG